MYAKWVLQNDASWEIHYLAASVRYYREAIKHARCPMERCNMALRISEQLAKGYRIKRNLAKHGLRPTIMR
jgi:hypothetical protein